MPDKTVSFTTRFRCPQCGAALVRDPGYTGQKRGEGLAEDTVLRCPKCQPPLSADNERKDAS